MIKTFDELEEEREMLISEMDQCDPDDETRLQELQDKIDLIEEEIELNPDKY